MEIVGKIEGISKIKMTFKSYNTEMQFALIWNTKIRKFMKNKKLNKINVVILLILFSLFPFVGCQQEELNERNNDLSFLSLGENSDYSALSKTEMKILREAFQRLEIGLKMIIFI